MAHREPIQLGVADLAGRVDAYYIGGAAFQIKHSSKRLPPWQFTYLPENLGELAELRRACNPVWAFLVCGDDGVVGLSLDELTSIAEGGAGGVAWIRITRSRHSMYRVAGAAGELPRAKARGVQAFVAALLERK